MFDGSSNVNNNVSKNLFADDVNLTITADSHYAQGPTVNCVIHDLNANNSTVIQNVTPAEDWCGGKYTVTAEGTVTAVEGWVDPRE